MGKYDIYDDKGSRKGEIRDNEFGRKGMDIFDDRGSKIGEIKPHYSVSDSSGAGCGITIAIIISIMFEIGLIIYGDLITKLMVILFQGADVLSCVICHKKSGDYEYLAIVPVIISVLVKIAIMVIITLFNGSEGILAVIFGNILVSLPVATINFVINIIASIKHDKY